MCPRRLRSLGNSLAGSAVRLGSMVLGGATTLGASGALGGVGRIAYLHSQVRCALLWRWKDTGAGLISLDADEGPPHRLGFSRLGHRPGLTSAGFLSLSSVSPSGRHRLVRLSGITRCLAIHRLTKTRNDLPSGPTPPQGRVISRSTTGDSSRASHG